VAECEDTDFLYPMTADIYYPLVEQGAYGNLKKQWVFDRMVVCNFTYASLKREEEVKPNLTLTQESILLGRVKNDLRISENKEHQAITNVIVTNIKTKSQELYLETSGPRSGKSTLYEIATHQPTMGPFGERQYFKVLLRRSENQASDL